MELLFEWDEDKADANLRKHKIGFDEARSIFADLNSVTIFDPQHSVDEERFIDIGMSSSGRLLVVVYTERAERIRIISCRKATSAEEKQYERNKS
ncbi:MAG: BrnT family toxin [Caldilineaceae bacterium]